MWSAISYITSGLALVAVLAAVIAWSYKAKTEERERLIRSAKESERRELVKNALEFFNIDAANLTKEQQFRLALEQIHARGRRFTISAAVICLLAVVAVCITAYAIAQHGRSSESAAVGQSIGVDPALVGSWESVGKSESTDVQLRFEIGADGKYSRWYFLDDGGVIEAAKGKLKMKGSTSAIPFEADYAFVGSDTLIVTQLSGNRALQPIGSIELKRVGRSDDYPQDLLVGTWKTVLLVTGANWAWTIEIGPQHNYHSHAETRDNGELTAQNGNWQMTSKWSAAPIVGTYQVIAGKPKLNLWPFGTIELNRAR
jgi:hypothetical protein